MRLLLFFLAVSRLSGVASQKKNKKNPRPTNPPTSPPILQPTRTPTASPVTPTTSPTTSPVRPTTSPTPPPVTPTPPPVTPTPPSVTPTSPPVTPKPPPVTPTLPPVTPTPPPVMPTPPPVTPTPPPTPSPVQSSATWGIDRIDQRNLPLSNSYGVSGVGSGVVAYIIDTGIQTEHNEFKDESGSRNRARWGINTTGDGNNRDCNGHGTHVAGTVGGLVYGVAKDVELVAVKVLGCGGSGSYAGVIEGIEWVMNDAAAKGKPATANLSLGGGASQAVDTAVKNLHDSGVVTVVAAGNSDTDACRASPAREPAVITVGSTTNSDRRSSFSNYGTCVDIFAPGSSVTSAWIGSNTRTRTISGTSMASPHVCGGVALLLGNGVNAAGADDTILENATEGKVQNRGTSSTPDKLLYVGEVGPTNAPTPVPPTISPAPIARTPAPTTKKGRRSSTTVTLGRTVDPVAKKHAIENIFVH